MKQPHRARLQAPPARWSCGRNQTLRTSALLLGLLCLTARAGWCPAISPGGPNGPAPSLPSRGSTPSNLPDQATVESRPAFPGTEGVPVSDSNSDPLQPGHKKPGKSVQGSSQESGDEGQASSSVEPPNNNTDSTATPSVDTGGNAVNTDTGTVGRTGRRVPPAATHPVNAREAKLNVAPPPVTGVGQAPRRMHGPVGQDNEPDQGPPVSPVVRILRGVGVYLVAMFVALLLLYQQFRRSVKPRKAVRRF